MKPFGVAVVAILAVTAFIGASSASAVTLCKANNSNTCEPANQYAGGTVIKAELEVGTKAVLKTNLVTVECSVSKSEGKTNETSGEPLLGLITALTFETCKTTKGVGCTVTVLNLPYKAAISASGGGNGSLTAVSDGTGNPGAKVVCGLVLNCTFSTPSANLAVVGGEPAKINAEEVELEPTIGSVCPVEALWTATYKVTAPTKVWVEERP